MHDQARFLRQDTISVVEPDPVSLTRPFFTGEPIEIQFRPALRAWRGRLTCGGDRGCEVHAASFLKRRLIVLDQALLHHPPERERILAHEIFHFVWWKLDRGTRQSYEQMIREEVKQIIPGEMGWSSELRKQKLQRDHWLHPTRPVREYLSESFCDTAAACLIDLLRHEEITLPASAHRRRRTWMRHWFEQTPGSGGLKL